MVLRFENPYTVIVNDNSKNNKYNSYTSVSIHYNPVYYTNQGRGGGESAGNICKTTVGGQGF